MERVKPTEQVPTECFAVNKQNRAYIDRFVSENYERLNGKFTTIENRINSSGFGVLDKLNETILTLYTDPALTFSNWEQANKYMTNKFTDKALRVPVRKQTREVDTEEDNNE